LRKKGLKIVGLKMIRVSRELAEKHYAEHQEKPFYPELVSFITSAPVVAMVVEGPKAVETVRKMMGKTNPLEAEPGTIRGDFGLSVTMNPHPRFPIPRLPPLGKSPSSSGRTRF
jgi:nucleoside-diphosphate kinase